MVALLLAGLLGVTSCGGSDDSPVKHQVYFVGYVYDGATGQRLGADQLTAISVKYRDQIIHTKIDKDDGRFVTTEPLPTWQDYSVYVAATGYRTFVSTNNGVDVPKSLQMTDGVSRTSTTQTFDVAVRLFPDNLKAPKVTITIEKADALVATPAPARAAGTLRLTPVSSSVVEQSSLALGAVWSNDEDLLTQTITKAFTEGSAEIAEGEMVYGVTYQLAIFGVPGYQPLSGSTSSGASMLLSAGSVASMLVTLQPDAKAPLRILGTNADKCTPPLPSAMAYGASIDITFSEEIEPAGPSFAEDIDNGLSLTVSSTTSSSFYCPLNTSLDPMKQEHGTKAAIAGRVLSLSFNPSVGISAITASGTTCTPPPALSAVTYALSNVMVQPKGDPVRKASVGTLLSQTGSSSTFPSTSSTSVSCGTRSTSSSF